MIESILLKGRSRPPKETPHTIGSAGVAAHHGVRPLPVATSADNTQTAVHTLDVEPAQVRRRSPRRPVLTDLLTRRPDLRAVVFADTLDALVRWSA